MPVETHEDIQPAAGIETNGAVETHEDIRPAMGMTAYHGSPHEFEEFDPAFIGTGEGAQAYGHGLYFAENEDIAKEYRDRLSDRSSSFNIGNLPMPKWILKKLEASADRNAAISEIRSDFQNRLAEAEAEKKSSHQPWLVSGRISSAKDILDGLDKIESGAAVPKTTGSMYEVRINAGPEHLLDWDKPLSEQPRILSALKEAHEDLPPFGNKYSALDRWHKNANEQNSGKSAYDELAHAVGLGEKGASDYLKQAGIRGIRYLDAGSRGKDGQQGSHNIVVFDPQHIKVKRRYAEGGDVQQGDDEGIVAYAFGNSVPHLDQRSAKTYGGAIAGPKLTEENAEDFARRLILWSYAAAPFVHRGISRADGGQVDNPDDQALDVARSAVGSDPVEAAVSTARSLSPMGFYSAAAEAASKIPQRAPIEQILNKVKGSPNVKAEELDWSGVRDAFTGKGSVDPKEVARHFQENLPQLQETVKYDPVDLSNKLAAKRQSLIFNGQRDEAEALKDTITQTYNPSWRRENAAKYKEYTLPDGENYREVLLHLPTKVDSSGSKEASNFANSMQQKYGERWIGMLTPEEERKYENLINSQSKKEDASTYQSSHWNVPNVVAHLRMSDRDWGKTLHIEETQSDWGQEGRDEGFVGSTNPSDIAALRDQHAKLNLLLSGPIEDINKSGYNISKLMEERKQLGQKITSLEERLKSERTPIGPHVTSNEGWTDLALKRALLEAAKGGYKKLVWTPGNEQAERYDLSNQVKHIMWSPDNKILSALTHDGSEAIGEKVEKEDLHKYIGKEAAKRLLDQEPEIAGNMATHHLRGQDISVGGEGMKNFYDRFVPNRLQKLVSKLDPEAKIQMNGHTIVVADKEDEDIDVRKKLHSLEITPKLRAAILKGLPAYEQGGSVDRSRLHFKDVTKRIPQLTEAASSGVSGREYQDLVNIHKPVKTWGHVPPPASYGEMYNALEPRKREKLGRDVNIPENHPVGLRLDIPAYRDHGVWIPTIHDRSSSANTVLAHAPHARISDVTFNIPQKKAEAVAKGGPKSPFATIDGRWKPTSISDAQDMAEAYLNHPDWRQVGMDPERHSYFYDRETQEPVTHAEEVLQVGPLVLAKNPTYGDRNDYSYERGGAIVNKALDVVSGLRR